MSYEIIYDKCFIKAEKDGKPVFFPMIYTGSNNCYQYDNSSRGRRERGWHNFTYILKGKRYGTLEEMLQSAQEERTRAIEGNKAHKIECEKKNEMGWFTEYSDDRWGYFTSLSFGGGCKSTFGQYKGLFMTGCRKALTVEELKEFGVEVSIRTGSYYYDDKGLAKLKKAGKDEVYYPVSTSAELFEKLEYYDEYIKGLGYIYLTIDASEYEMKRIRREKFPKSKREKQRVELDKYFVVKDTSTGNYVLKATRNGYKYSYNGRSYCRTYAKESDAKRFAKKMNDKMFRVFVVEEVNEKIMMNV